MRDGSFPEPLKVGVRAVRWRESEIEGWLAHRSTQKGSRSAGRWRCATRVQTNSRGGKFTENESVDEIGENRSACHIGASNLFPGFLPGSSGSRSYEMGQLEHGRWSPKDDANDEAASSSAALLPRTDEGYNGSIRPVSRRLFRRRCASGIAFDTRPQKSVEWFR